MVIDLFIIGLLFSFLFLVFWFSFALLFSLHCAIRKSSRFLLGNPAPKERCMLVVLVFHIRRTVKWATGSLTRGSDFFFFIF